MEKSTREKYLFEKASVFEAILKLAFPTVIGQIILVIYNMADTFFVGLAGSDEKLTAVTVCMPAFMFLSAISNLFGVGGSSVISRSLGSKNPERAKGAASFAIWGCMAVTLLYALLAFLFSDLFVNLLGGSDPSVHAYASEYLLVTVVLGGFGTSMNTLLGHLVRSEGRSLHASIGIALGGILNIGLDPLFMFVLLPEGCETLGAAVATALSNLIALVYFIVVIARIRGKSVISFKMRTEKWSSGMISDLLMTGLPACLMTLFENISYAILDNLISSAGVVIQAGIGVAKKVNMLAHCIVRGMTQGVLPLIGYSFAAGNIKRMRTTVLTSTTLSVVMASLCMTASLLFSRTLVGLFIHNNPESLAAGARFLRILALGGPFSACAYAFISFFQAVGRGKRSFILAIMRKGLIDIPMMFALSAALGCVSCVWATPVTDMICCGVAIFFFVTFMKRHPAKN